MPLGPALDGMIAAIAPTWAEKRARSRLRFEMIRAKAFYDGATRGRRFDGWRTPYTGPASESRPALELLRARSRDLVRNNPWATRACSAIPDDTVGYGIEYAITHPSARVQDRLRGLARDHLESTAIDADGRHTFYGLQWLAMRTVAESGEAIGRQRARRPSDSLPLPFQVQLMEPDHLDSNREGPTQANGRIVQGVEFLPTGRRDAYWLYQEHPGEAGIYSNRTDSRRIPASDVLHVYRMDRPGQVRGIPWGAPCIVKLKDFGDYQDAQLVRQKIAAAFGPIETSPDAEPDANPPKPQVIEPGMFTRASPGYQLVFPDPPTVAGYAEHTNVELHAVAAGFGVPYEVLTGDLSQVNFSSGRMGRLGYYRSIDQWLWRMMIPLFCEPVMRWFLEQAELLIPGALQARVQWTPPKREMIDPTREVPAKRDEIAAALITWSEAVRERGYDPEQFKAEYVRDLEWLREQGIKAYEPGSPWTMQQAEPDESRPAQPRRVA